MKSLVDIEYCCTLTILLYIYNINIVNLNYFVRLVSVDLRAVYRLYTWQMLNAMPYLSNSGVVLWSVSLTLFPH